jgi:hypothetical protein
MGPAETSTGSGLFLGAAALGVAVTVITEGLSLARRLTPGWLGVSWGIAGAIALAAVRARRHGAPSAPPPPRGAAAVVGAILALTGVMALVAPPNNWDSMTYHMPRVAHWSQAGSVAHYPTHILRQLWLGPWAEFAITHLYLAGGGDRLANLVQWLAFVGCVAGAAIVTGELGGGPWARAGAAIATATLPMAIAQASSTQNDLVGSFWLLSLGYWVLRFRATPSVRTAGLIGVSAGLAGLTKLPVWFPAIPWLVAFAASAVAANGRRRGLVCILVAGVSAGVLNAGHVGRTARLLWDGGGPAASDPAGRVDRLPPVWTAYTNTTLDPRAVASNALRNMALHLATPSPRANAWLERAIVGAHRFMAIDPNDPRTTLGGPFPEFHVGPWLLHEDFTGNPLHLLAGLVAGVLLWRRRVACGAAVRRWAWLVLASAVTFVVVLKWQPWNSRLHLPLFVLGCPLLGVALTGSRRRAVAWTATFCLVALPSLAVTWPRTLIGPDSVLTMPRTAQRFRNHPKLQPVYEAAVGVVGDMRCPRVGLVLGWDDLEYPFWPLLRARLGPELRMEHVLVRNASARLGPPAAGAPCALLVVGDTVDGPVDWQGRAFVERWRWPPVRVYQPAR